MIYRSLLFSLLILTGCSSEKAPELIIHNAAIYFSNSDSAASAVSVENGKIVAIGADAEVLATKNENTQLIDAGGAFLMPGFIEGHGHFSGLGRLLGGLNFLTSESWDEIVEEVGEAAKKLPKGSWIEGRGWHQEKWKKEFSPSVAGYPTSFALDSIAPEHPVILYHASGHGLFANQAAMNAAGISNETPDPVGGKIIREPFGKATGVFEENAARLVRDAYREYQSRLTPEEVKAQWLHQIELATADCLKKGITSFQDAGSTFQEIEWYNELAENKALDLRLWVMLRHSYDQMKDSMSNFPIINTGPDFFTCNAIKTEVDGALGAHGAWLLAPYEDRPGFLGQNTTTTEEVKNIAGLATASGMQLCVHAIGDRANREVLDIIEQEYAKVPEKKDLRWRIEHAQHLHPDDIQRFKSIGVIASMQGIHCTSDAPFVEKRLGEKRSREGAYAWRSLLDAGVAIANGTDAPVEDVDPLPSYYASVTRKRQDNGFEFFPEQAMTRKEALHSYTLGNAYAAFEEDKKGSIEVGKLADFVLLSNNLITCPEEEILNTKVLATIVGGKVKYENLN